MWTPLAGLVSSTPASRPTDRARGPVGRVHARARAKARPPDLEAVKAKVRVKPVLPPELVRLLRLSGSPVKTPLARGIPVASHDACEF